MVIKKYIVSFVVVFLISNPPNQLITLIAISSINLITSILLRPYQYLSLNILRVINDISILAIFVIEFIIFNTFKKLSETDPTNEDSIN